jgi:hypothetical protein
MPDQLNKQSIINLLIDSPLREPIKINLIDIVNNTSDVDLPKVFPTITKELEIFQKATERRMKLADETIAKFGGTAPAAAPAPTTTATPAPVTPAQPDSGLPHLDLSPLPTPPAPMPVVPQPTMSEPLSVPPLDLPPLPTSPMTPPAAPVMPTVVVEAPQQAPTPAPSTTPAPDADEAALAEIQKELDSLKSSAAADAAPAVNPAQ